MVISNQPPLKPLHTDNSLIESKLDKYGKLSDQELIDSLKPGNKVRSRCGPTERWSMVTIASRFFGIGASMWIPCRER